MSIHIHKMYRRSCRGQDRTTISISSMHVSASPDQRDASTLAQPDVMRRHLIFDAIDSSKIYSYANSIFTTLHRSHIQPPCLPDVHAAAPPKTQPTAPPPLAPPLKAASLSAPRMPQTKSPNPPPPHNCIHPKTRNSPEAETRDSRRRQSPDIRTLLTLLLLLRSRRRRAATTNASSRRRTRNPSRRPASACTSPQAEQQTPPHPHPFQRRRRPRQRLETRSQRQ